MDPKDDIPAFDRRSDSFAPLLLLAEATMETAMDTEDGAVRPAADHGIPAFIPLVFRIPKS